jgi:hypothetical protein
LLSLQLLLEPELNMLAQAGLVRAVFPLQAEHLLLRLQLVQLQA